jgi:beta-lactam-binding protein with PASTA domain
VPEGTKIVMKYSPAPESLLTVPDFAAMNAGEATIRADAAAYLKQYNLVFMVADANDPTHPDNVVIAQSVAAGTKVPYGTVITLTVNPPL